ncbi:MAG: SOS response-associated peptidase [Amphritea sp.]
MCGRYNIVDGSFTRTLLEALGVPGHLETRYNIAPTESVPVIRNTPEGREISHTLWWLIPSWAPEPGTKYSMFNARAETLTKSRAFRHPFKQQRCIMPASSFIEWHIEDGKQPYEISAIDRALVFAGIWDHWGEGAELIYSCSMITTEAVPELQHIHNRMPLMLSQDMIGQWLDPCVTGEELLPLLEPQLTTSLIVTPVDRWINSSRHKDPPRVIAAGKIIG